MIVGIDASNIRAGGGVTHLMELLNNTNFEDHKITKLYIWSSSQTLACINDHSSIVKKTNSSLNSNGLLRFFWRIFILDKEVKKENCDILFIPGSLYSGNFHPYVTISQNILPFDKVELNKFFPSFNYFRLNLLRYLQAQTFRNADGLIFLSNYASVYIKNLIGKINGTQIIIPHGISPRFRKEPKKQLPISSYSEASPYNLLYTSVVSHYKHQWNVIQAVSMLRKDGYPVVLNLVGGFGKMAFKKVKTAIKKYDPNGEFTFYQGKKSFGEIEKYYSNADAFVFASSCENLPNIMIEAMASGLPIASSFTGPMFEVLRDSGFYFDPYSPESIYKSIKNMIDNPELRIKYSENVYSMGLEYDWRLCSKSTFDFISSTFNNYKK